MPKKLPLRRLLTILTSVLLITFVFWSSGVENILQKLIHFPRLALAGILFLLVANLFLVSFRFWRVLAHFGIALPWKSASRACVAGHVAGLAMISLIGQVVGRQTIMRNFGVAPIVNASLAAYERAVLTLISGTLAVLGGIYLLGQAVIADFFLHTSFSEIAIAACGGGALSLLLGRSNFETRLSSQLLSTTNLARVVLIIGLTIVAQLLVQSAFVLAIMAISPHSNLVSLFAAAAIISFAASIPITVNGWGVREVVAVYVLGHLGISAVDAVTVSVILGLSFTLVTLVAAPFAFKQTPPAKLPLRAVTVHSVAEIELSAAWILGMATTVLIFFQFHAPLPSGDINVNLADPFAILALAATGLHMLFARQMPRWRIGQFNLVLLLISAMLLFGFVRGWFAIGITQWALGGRLFGWLILLGYLSAGYLIVANAGSHGFRRMVETLITTAAFVVAFTLILRLLDQWGIIAGLQLPLNFEGYAGNRNAFAFQLLTVIAALLGYSRVYAKHSIYSHSTQRLWLISLLFGVLLAGLIWTASRAGLLVGTATLLLAWFTRIGNRSMLLRGLFFTAVFWAISWLAAHSFTDHHPIVVVQSAFSNEISDHERWITFSHAIDLFRTSPIFGAGLGVFYAGSPAWLGHHQVIHNTLLWILAEFGIMGVAIIGWSSHLLVRYARKFSAPQPARRILLLLLLTFAGFSLAHEILYQRIFWLVLGATLAQTFAARWRT